MDNIAPEAPRDPSDPLVKAIDRFFDVVIEDPLLKLYFFDTDIGRLKENFVTYLTYLFADKETQYKEKSLLAAHAGRDITDEAAARFSEKLLTALSDCGAAPRDIETLRGKLPALEILVVDKFVSPDTHVYIPQRMK